MPAYGKNLSPAEATARVAFLATLHPANQSPARVWPQKAHLRIGILGSGLMGSKLGTRFARAGLDVIFSYSRSRQKLAELARETCTAFSHPCNRYF